MRFREDVPCRRRLRHRTVLKRTVRHTRAYAIAVYRFALKHTKRGALRLAIDYADNSSSS